MTNLNRQVTFRDWLALALACAVGIAIVKLCSSCASNACMIDASIQQQRLIDAGIPARIATVDAKGNRHAVVLWKCSDGRQYIWDGSRTIQFTGNEHDAVALLGMSRNLPCRFVCWEEQPK